jgi:ABC-type transport system substrate-binding protein
VVFVVLVVLIAGSVSIAALPRGGTLRVGLNADPPNMDPHQSTAAVDRQVFENLYDKLVDINQNLEIVPMLASSWQIADGGRTYTFKLRQGVVFHDGTPFNAEAVKFNFDRILDKSFDSPRFSEVNLVTGGPPVGRARSGRTRDHLTVAAVPVYFGFPHLSPCSKKLCRRNTRPDLSRLRGNQCGARAELATRDQDYLLGESLIM